jgi:putative tryptophan/tyrosine transport system substrate-binding protein
VRRREIIGFLGGAAAWPLTAQAQQPALALVGLLSSVHLDDRQVGAIRQGLKDGGYIEGRNVAIKYRSADARFDRLPALVADLVADPVAVIVALAPPAAVAARAATTTIPIVFVVGCRRTRDKTVGNVADAGPERHSHRVPHQRGKPGF